MSATINPNHPNIQIVTGNDVFGNNSEFRDRLRDAIYRLANPPASRARVTRGSHDFWITYRVPDPDMGSNWDREDMGIRDDLTGRRPMRGIVFMNLPRDDSDTTMVNQVTTILQEVAHHWLVPDNLAFRTPQGGELHMLSLRDIVGRQNDDEGLNSPALLGRDRIHWSTYFDADGSPFDGVHWRDRGDEHGNGVIRWDQEDMPGWTVTQTTNPVRTNLIPGTPVWTPPLARRIQLNAKYNDLDLILMDTFGPRNAYPDNQNQVRWFQPFLTSNMNYHAGITVALSRFDQIIFGFFKDHRKLALQRSGGPLLNLVVRPSPILDLGAGRDLFRQTALRVIRIGQDLRFEVAEPEIGDLINAGSFASGGVPPPPFALRPDQFHVVAQLTVPQTPVGVGALLKTWDGSVLVEADYSEIRLSDSRGNRPFPVDADPSDFARDDSYERALSSDRIMKFDMPGIPGVRASFVRTHPRYFDGRDRLLQLGTRYCVNPIMGEPVGLDNADHWTGVDRAPKALVRVQPGNFTFGVRMRIRRCIFSPSTGGAAEGSSMWGYRGSTLLANNVVIPNRDRERWVGNNVLRIAFIVVARQEGDITADHLSRIDNIRRFWDITFNVSTRGRWLSISELWPYVQPQGGPP